MPPQLTPNSAIMKAADVAALAGILRISCILIEYMQPDVKVPSTVTANNAPAVNYAAGKAMPPGATNISKPAMGTTADAVIGEWAIVAECARPKSGRTIQLSLDSALCKLDHNIIPLIRNPKVH